MIHVLFENPSWLPPLEDALRARGLRYRCVDVTAGCFDFSEPPPEGTWLNRVSPSAHTRGHAESIELMREVLQWLEAHGRRVVNGSRAFALEVSKAQQDAVLRKYGIVTPKTLLAVGRPALLEAAGRIGGPFVIKHNCGGKGLGVERFEDVATLRDRIETIDLAASPNGQFIVQAYVAPREPFITRVELVAGEMVLAMRSSTSQGFELCPSDACQAERAPDVCPADGSALFSPSPLLPSDPLVAQYRDLCAGEGIEVAGIELIEASDGTRYTYDINANTNYNAAFGRQLGVDAMAHLVAHLVNPMPWPTSSPTL